MADLDYIHAAQEVKIAGQDSSGNNVNYVGADTNGNMLVKDFASGSATGGTAATVSSLVGGIFNSSLPTLTNGQQSAIQFDSSGRLLVGSIASALPAGTNNIGTITQGAAGTAAQGWFSKITDGTNTATVKAASTAPTGTDTALVSVLSPNGNQATAANQTSEITLLTSIQSTSNSTAVNTNSIAANQTNGTQRTLVSDLVGNLQPSGDAPARTLYVRINDGTNNVTSTTINSKQRLDVNTASEGTAGSAVPFQSIQVGGSDGTNLRTIKTDTSGNLIIVGTAADGAAAAGNPVQIAGKDGSGNTQTVTTDTAGNVFASSKIPTTPAAPGTVSAGVTSGTLVAANTSRKGLVVTNVSTLGTISLNIVGGAAVLNSGITLFPHDSWYMDEFTFTTSQVNVIASLASTSVAIQEVS